MNIMVLSAHPATAARYHQDVHVRSQLKEGAQMASTVCAELGVGEDLYKPTHPHHPCVRWLLERQANFYWAFLLWTALNWEFVYRFDKDHASVEVVLEARKRLVHRLPPGSMTPWPQAVDEEFQLPVSGKEPYDDAHPSVVAYRNYYACQKAELLNNRRILTPAEWTRRDRPPWMSAPPEPTLDVESIWEEDQSW